MNEDASKEQLHTLPVSTVAEKYSDIPIDAIALYWRNTCYDVRRANANGCTTQMFDAANMAIEMWLESIGK